MAHGKISARQILASPRDSQGLAAIWRLRLARWSIKASICLALIGKRLHDI